MTRFVTHHGSGPNRKMEILQDNVFPLGVINEMDVIARIRQANMLVDRRVLQSVVIAVGDDRGHGEPGQLPECSLSVLRCDASVVEEVAHDKQGIGMVSYRGIDHRSQFSEATCPGKLVTDVDIRRMKQTQGFSQVNPYQIAGPRQV